MIPKDKQAILHEFREGLLKEGLIHDKDTIGTDDETLLYVLHFFPFLILSPFFLSAHTRHAIASVHAVDSCARATTTSSRPRSCGRTANTGGAPSRASASTSFTAK